MKNVFNSLLIIGNMLTAENEFRPARAYRFEVRKILLYFTIVMLSGRMRFSELFSFFLRSSRIRESESSVRSSVGDSPSTDSDVNFQVQEKVESYIVNNFHFHSRHGINLTNFCVSEIYFWWKTFPFLCFLSPRENCVWIFFLNFLHFFIDKKNNKKTWIFFCVPSAWGQKIMAFNCHLTIIFIGLCLCSLSTQSTSRYSLQVSNSTSENQTIEKIFLKSPPTMVGWYVTNLLQVENRKKRKWEKLNFPRNLCT